MTPCLELLQMPLDVSLIIKRTRRDAMVLVNSKTSFKTFFMVAMSCEDAEDNRTLYLDHDSKPSNSKCILVTKQNAEVSSYQSKKN